MAEESAGKGLTANDKARSAISVARVRVWLEAARRSAGVERVDGKLVYEQISTAYLKTFDTNVRDGKANPRFHRHADGKTSPNKNTLERVDAVWPGTRDAHDIGPFEGDEPVRLWAAFEMPSTDLWDIVCDAFPEVAESLLDGRPHYARIGTIEAAIARLFDEPLGDSPASEALRRYSQRHPLSLKVLAGILAFWRLSLLVFDDRDERIYRMVAFAVHQPFRPILEEWDAYPALWDAISEVHTVETAKLGELIGKYARMSPVRRVNLSPDTAVGQREPLPDKAVSGVSNLPREN